MKRLTFCKEKVQKAAQSAISYLEPYSFPMQVERKTPMTYEGADDALISPGHRNSVSPA